MDSLKKNNPTFYSNNIKKPNLIVQNMELKQKRQNLLLLSIKYKGDYFLIKKNFFLNKIPALTPEYNLIIQTINNKYVTIFDKEYPFYLKQIEQPPWVLYYIGDFSILNNFFIFAVIGKRKHTPLGSLRTNYVIDNLKATHNKPVIVSGCAIGIDRCAHEYAMTHDLKTVGVLGFGFNYIYPSQNDNLFEKLKQNHLLISEYPYFTEIKKQQFKARNRIISGLSKAIFIIEAGQKSGTLNTAFHAFNNNRDIYCFYDHFDKNSGANYLLDNNYATEILI